MQSSERVARVMRINHAVLTALLLGIASPAMAQSSNVLLDQIPSETICADQEGFPAAALTDGDLETLWQIDGQTAPCHFVYRFEEPIAVASLTLHNRLGKGAGVPSRRATIWASHQDVGAVYFRLAHEQLNDEGATVLVFDEPVLMRSLKVSVENEVPFSGQRLTASLAEIELTTVDPTTAGRWPMPRPEPLVDGDPVTMETATRCDELAGHLYNPDSYGYGRLEDEIDTPLALTACREAIALQPDSMRLAYQLARVENLSEQTVQSVARLASPLLEAYPPAMLELAVALREGRGVAQNTERADALIEAAAEAGYLPALYEIAQSYDEAYRNALITGEEVAGESLSPALQSLLEAAYLPAYQLYNAHILRTDSSELLAFMPRLEEAAEYGDVGILPQHLYNNEHGIPADQRRALRWVRDSLEHNQDGDTLGNLSIAAHWVLGNNQLALRAARLGAYSGEAWPVQQLAIRGGGSSPSELLAFSYRAALQQAEAGSAGAMFDVGELLIEGRGVEQDREEGARWIRLAAAAGEARAVTFLQQNSWARDE